MPCGEGAERVTTRLIRGTKMGVNPSQREFSGRDLVATSDYPCKELPTIRRMSWWWVFDPSATHGSCGALSQANPGLSFAFQRREPRRIGTDRNVDRLIDVALVEERRGSKVIDVAFHLSRIRVILPMSMLVLYPL